MVIKFLWGDSVSVGICEVTKWWTGTSAGADAVTAIATTNIDTLSYLVVNANYPSCQQVSFLITYGFILGLIVLYTRLLNQRSLPRIITSHLHPQPRNQAPQRKPQSITNTNTIRLRRRLPNGLLSRIRSPHPNHDQPSGHSLLRTLASGIPAYGENS